MARERKLTAHWQSVPSIRGQGIAEDYRLLVPFKVVDGPQQSMDRTGTMVLTPNEAINLARHLLMAFPSSAFKQEAAGITDIVMLAAKLKAMGSV